MQKSGLKRVDELFYCIRVFNWNILKFKDIITILSIVISAIVRLEWTSTINNQTLLIWLVISILLIKIKLKIIIHPTLNILNLYDLKNSLLWLVNFIFNTSEFNKILILLSGTIISTIGASETNVCLRRDGALSAKRWKKHWNSWMCVSKVKFIPASFKIARWHGK